jgi:hypothetical protein
MRGSGYAISQSSKFWDFQDPLQCASVICNCNTSCFANVCFLEPHPALWGRNIQLYFTDDKTKFKEVKSLTSGHKIVSGKARICLQDQSVSKTSHCLTLSFMQSPYKRIKWTNLNNLFPGVALTANCCIS